MQIENLVIDANNFANFNPMQKKALNIGIFDKSVVVSSPTAAGKTIIAELCSLNSIINKKKKVVYTCPLRALASEHFNDFKKKYSKKLGIRIAISTGDFDSSSNYLQNYDLIFTTFEKLDSLLRHRASWLSAIGLLIIDEIHELDSDRGPTIEITITKLRHSNPHLQFLALSATIPNAKEIAQWLNANLVESSYRPVKLLEGVLFDGVIEFRPKTEQIEKKKEPLPSIVFDTLKKQKQALVFANTRKRSSSMAKKLSSITESVLTKREKIKLENASKKILSTLESPTEQCAQLAEAVKKGCAFHNAGLLSSQRKVVEDLFRQGEIKIVCSTPSLAAGINMPAFRVVIPSLYRYTSLGNVRIPVREYKQMCLPHDAKIFTEEFGEIEIGKVVNKKLKCKVLSWSEKTKKLEFKHVKTYFNNGRNKLLKLKTNVGGSIKLTPNHPVLIKEKEKFVWKKANDIRKADKLIHLKNIGDLKNNSLFFIDLLPRDNSVYVQNVGSLIFEAKRKLKLTEKELSSKLKVNYKTIYHQKHNKKAIPFEAVLKLCDLLLYSKQKRVNTIRKVKTACGTPALIPKMVNADFLWLAGFIATDGNINHIIDKRTKSEYTTIRLFNKNKKLINKVNKILKNFELTSYIRKREDGLITLEVGATLISKILKNHFGIPFGNKTTNVKVPNFLFNSSKELIGAYLGGVFDGDGNYNEATQRYGSKVRRVLFVSASKEFANGIQKLLLRLGIVATLFEKRKKLRVLLKNKFVSFKKPTFYVVFRKIEYLIKFQQYAQITKCKIDVSYSGYHNINKFHNKADEQIELVGVLKKKRIDKTVNVYNLQIEGNENYFADDILVHNCGRAGRPAFDSSGQSILFANSQMESDELFETYINGEIESIYSKLGIEPVLRTHLLSVIATNFVFDLASMEEFFSKTFYAHQFKDMGEFFEKISKILKELEEMGFVKSSDKKFSATLLGNRVSELYLDPFSAFEMITALKQNKFFDLSYLFLLTNTSEFYPQFSVSKKFEPELWERLQEEKEFLPVKVDEEMFFDENLLKKFNSTLLLSEWINEISEENILKQFNTAPGLLRTKLLLCDWLAYSASELSRLLGLKKHIAPLNRLRKRLKNGVKAELIFLTELRGIGRVRARRLFRAGIKSISDVKKTDIKDLERVIPPAVAVKIKHQLKL